MVPVRWKTRTTRDHKPNARIAVQRMPIMSEISGAPVLSLRDVSTDMLARQIPVEGHMLYRHLFIKQRDNKAIAKVACQ